MLVVETKLAGRIGVVVAVVAAVVDDSVTG